MPELLASLDQEVSELKWRNFLPGRGEFRGCPACENGRDAVGSPLESAPVDWFLDVSYFNSEHLPGARMKRRWRPLKFPCFFCYFILY